QWWPPEKARCWPWVSSCSLERTEAIYPLGYPERPARTTPRCRDRACIREPTRRMIPGLREGCPGRPEPCLAPAHPAETRSERISTMRVCHFEDAQSGDLEPLSLTRPVFDLLCGCENLGQKQAQLFQSSEQGALVREHLVEVT